MKKSILTSILAALVAFGTTAKAQDFPDEYLGLPGDNLNLYAVMKLFQESETLEGFERNLNDENSRINNLDLNGDNMIDYITVTDYSDRDDHTIVLRVALNRKEFQDVAVFTVQRFNNGSVQIQLIGDEALYGKNYIIEPIYEETPNPGYTGRPENRTYVTVVRTTPYDIAAWPLIRFIYLPNYIAWRSAWYWGYYPDWWSPWRPYYWHYYYGYHYNWYNDYYAHYHHWNVCRWNRYNDFYYHGVRAYSPTVVVNINKNVYRTTYSHPEQRKEGEALYTRTNPDRGTRTMESRQPNGNRQPANASRQPQGTSREATRSSGGQNNSSAGRSQNSGRTNPSASGRSEYKPEQSRSSQNAGSTRTNPSASGRSEYKPEQSRSGQNAGSSQSRNNQSARSAQTSRSTANAGSSKSSRSSQSARSSQNSRSSQGTRASSSSNRSQKSSASRSSQSGKSSSSKSSGSDKDSGSRRK
jgi:hypothetical protein